MQDKPKLNNFWPGLLVIVGIYTAYYLLFADNKALAPTGLAIRHLLKMGVLIVIYLAGSFFLRKLPHPWLIIIWHLIHVSLISLLVFLWAWHFIISPLPLHIRRFGYSLHEFLISPLLYVATALLGDLVLKPSISK